MSHGGVERAPTPSRLGSISSFGGAQRLRRLSVDRFLGRFGIRHGEVSGTAYSVARVLESRVPSLLGRSRGSVRSCAGAVSSAFGSVVNVALNIRVRARSLAHAECPLGDFCSPSVVGLVRSSSGSVSLTDSSVSPMPFETVTMRAFDFPYVHFLHFIRHRCGNV